MSDRPDQDDSERRYTFPRSHRLKRRRLIRSLFDRSRDDVDTVAVGCVRLLYRVVDREAIGHDVPLQVGFAPGRRVDSGVERNRVRRLLREVYRVHQHTLVDLFLRRSEALIVMILFRGAPAQADECIEQDLPRAMQQVASRFEPIPEEGS
ncbi:ribonuclease P protein component [Salinibacter sp. 10B]|uniref:ribonuclease P protein component n=1 Tax=Salinibacter sp. 10B TaxID=1923971 RepID=UPI000CF3D458|nr:ribonuclease P protein component [Salinibacter sp. 10B]